MKRTTLIGLGIIAIALIAAGCSTQEPKAETPPPNTPPPTQETSSVTIQNFAFSPADLVIKQGTTVTWTNQDDVQHTVKFDFQESPILSKGQSYSYTFNEKGTFDYICGLHPSMKAKVTVD
ncbi:MAG: cupredoxin family copper-binding protein [archaeon]